ncbi:MAG: hypothetical protein ACOH2J_15380 [Allorhizobium sp.]
MQSSSGITVADEQPEVAIDLECVLKDLGFGCITSLTNLCAVELEENFYPSDWRVVEVEATGSDLAQYTREEQFSAFSASMTENEFALFSEVAIFLEDRWCIAPQAYAGLPIAEIDFPASDDADAY